MITLAIATAMIACWVLGVLHPALIGFLGCFLFVAVAGVEFETAFAGFGTETPWFFYGALLLSAAAERSGLVRGVRAGSPRRLTQSIVAAAIALVAIAYVLAFAVPSSLARATLLMILAQAWGPSTSLALAAGYGAAAFGHPEMAGGPRSVVAWDLAVIAAIVAAVTMAGSRSRAPGIAASETPARSRALLIPVAAAMALWLTSPLHSVSPALVGLACGLVCLLPGVAPRDKRAADVDHLAVIFLGTAITIPMALEETGGAEVLNHAWTAVTASAAETMRFWSTVAYRLFSPDGARPGLPSLAAQLGSDAIWSYAGSTFLSLHQSPALILAYAVSGCRPKQVLTVGALVLILGSLVVLLL